MLEFTATAAFGLEAVVKREAAQLGFSNINVHDGRVDFSAGLEAIPKGNLWFRSADRLLLRIGQFPAYTFDELFEKTKALPWDEWITKDGQFTVTGKSHKSKLFSVPDVQSIVKKAVVEKLKLKYKIDRFAETGPAYTIQAALLKDEVTLTIDTTGTGRGLHKRGYRSRSVTAPVAPNAPAAPLKETMAAALISLTYWNKDRIFLDPTCGSGTIPIEAAMIAKNIAPGLSRSFASEGWPQIAPKLWKDARAEAYAAIRVDITPEIFGSDIDPNAITLAQAHAEAAGVDDCITFAVKPLNTITLPGDYGVAIANPPYGERLGHISEAQKLYADMGRIFKNNTWSVYVLTSDEFFEASYGRRADAKRKLFNGMIKTDYYQFFGKRPSKGNTM